MEYINLPIAVVKMLSGKYSDMGTNKEAINAPNINLIIFELSFAKAFVNIKSIMSRKKFNVQTASRYMVTSLFLSFL